MGRWDDFTVDEVKFMWVALRSLEKGYSVTCALLPNVPEQVKEDMKIVSALVQECEGVVRQNIDEFDV